VAATKRARIRWRGPWIALLAALLVLLAPLGCRNGVPELSAERPNFLLIVADDLGYSDLGSYGSEIPTPHLDALAEDGTRAIDFYVSSRGAPTRAMLMTGVDNHVAGFGRPRSPLAPTEAPAPGQQGWLRPNVVTVATLLRDAGYHTYMAGKWEIGGGKANRPAGRGFERSFALHDGSASHWSDMKSARPGRELAFFTRNGENVSELPEDYFSSRYYTDFLGDSIEENIEDGRPFFAYLAFQAPHSPLAAPDDWRDRFAGRYEAGFDAIRDARLMRMKQKKLVREEVVPFPGIPTVPKWDDLDEGMQKSQARRMEIYAAMVANLDHQVGRLLERLRKLDAYEDTVIVFLSDNGTEPGDRGPMGMQEQNREWYAQQFPEHDEESWGGPGSFVEYGPGWAQVGTVPFRLFKGTLAEGGVRSPLIVSGPGVKRDQVTRAVLQVTDLTPTLLDMAGVDHPTEIGGRKVAPLWGSSLADHLAGEFWARNGPHTWIGMGFAGDQFVRKERWKLIRMRPPFGSGKWRLFRIDLDPSELYDRSESNAAVRDELEALWALYAKAVGAVEPEDPKGPVASRADSEANPQR
jgi:arylsulfatase